MGEICEVCQRPFSMAENGHRDYDCHFIGYEREKAARAALEQRLAELEGVAASRADAALLRGRAAHDAQEKVRALEQQVVELREALVDLAAGLQGTRCAHCHNLLIDKAPEYPAPGSCEACVGGREALARWYPLSEK